jgi:protein-S-isoprenylcysteine O-methyltransferase Ste14
MSALARRALGGALRFIFFLAALLLVVSGSLFYWQLWLFLAVLSVSVFAITFYLLRHDPVLLARRMMAGPRAERERSQKIIMGFGAVVFFTYALLPGFDHRFGWSSVPDWAVFLGDFAVVAGMLIVFFVFRQNSFASSTVEIHPDQQVISTGLYGIVRHPMYMGALLFTLGTPVALGSWWGLILFPAIVAVLAWRLVDEERLLNVKLAGYVAYRDRVRHRLLPLIW